MENIEQENNQPEKTEETIETPQVVQLVPPKEAIDRMAEIEKEYLKTIERENK